MLATTPTTSVPDAIMLEFLADDPENADRIYRAKTLVEAGHVERSNLPGLWLVRSASTENDCYRVANGCCNCPDAARVGAQNCKHAVSCRIYRALERAETDADQLITIMVEPEDEAIPYWPADGEHPDLPALCTRCHAEPRTSRHRDGLGARCIAAELYGTEV